MADPKIYCIELDGGPNCVNSVETSCITVGEMDGVVYPDWNPTIAELKGFIDGGSTVKVRCSKIVYGFQTPNEPLALVTNITEVV